MSNPTVSIAIAAYQAEKAISELLSSLLSQKESGFVIDEIIVHIDGDLDNTKQVVAGFSDTRIKILLAEPRKGFAQAIKTIFENNVSDIVVILNDDISIKDDLFISKIIHPFLNYDNIGMVCGNPQPLKPRTFVEKAIVSTFRAYERVVTKLNNGNNPFCVDGKSMAFKKELVNVALHTEKFDNMGNVDAYLYFLCKEKGYGFYFANEAIMYFHNPSTFNDYVEWFARNNAQKYILKLRFPQTLLNAIRLPKPQLIFSSLIEFAKNPIGGIFIITFRSYVKIKSWFYARNFNNTWGSINSSKNNGQ